MATVTATRPRVEIDPAVGSHSVDGNSNLDPETLANNDRSGVLYSQVQSEMPISREATYVRTL